jgi:glycosyltransferase involved in cell wall biosynthesis
MRIFINAATLRVGGGKFVAINFLKSLSKIQESIGTFQIVAAVPNDEEFLQFSTSQFKIILTPRKYNNPLLRYFLLDKWLIKQAQTCGIIFSMGNIAVPQNRLPQVILFHIPHCVYPESVAWARMDFNGWVYAKLYVYFFNRRLKYANHIIAQTQTMRNRLMQIYGIAPEKISVCSNAYKMPSENNKISDLTSKIERVEGTYYLFCLTHYYPHKNLEILVELAKLIKEKKMPFKIVITISAKQHPAAKNLLSSINKANLESVILNIGPVASSELQNCYHSVDALLLPTLLESFSGTYLEAMIYQKPIFTSDLDFAREICGDAACYFNPLDATEILKVIEKTFNNPLEIEYLVSKGNDRIKNLPDWDDVGKKIFDVLINTKPSIN